jgi:hypothetical protein
MKKFFAIALLGFAALALTTGSASAGWLRDHCCKKKCCVTLCPKQYNAFSPCCIEGLPGCLPLGGLYGPDGCAPGCEDGGAPSQPGPASVGGLPAMGATNGQATVANPVPLGAPIYNGGFAPVPNGQAWTPGMINPSGVPGYYQPNLLGYGQGR